MVVVVGGAMGIRALYELQTWRKLGRLMDDTIW